MDSQHAVGGPPCGNCSAERSTARISLTMLRGSEWKGPQPAWWPTNSWPITANQAALRSNFGPRYDYILTGSGLSGSVVARRLAENMDVQVLRDLIPSMDGES